MDALTTLKIVELGLTDIERIVADEKASFPPFLQASRNTIRQRLDFGHIMLGAEIKGGLIGKVCFSYTDFSPTPKEDFPKTFRQFSTQPRLAQYNAAFVYNLNINPVFRGSCAVYALIQTLVKRVCGDGCKYIVFDARPSSYAGNSCEQERVKFKPGVKALFDNYLLSGDFPTDGEFCQDPTLAFYYRLGGKFLWIMPNFLPEDRSAGGFRVIMHKEISYDDSF